MSKHKQYAWRDFVLQKSFGMSAPSKLHLCCFTIKPLVLIHIAAFQVSAMKGSVQTLCYSRAPEHLALKPGPTLTLVHMRILPIPPTHDKINLLLSTASQNLFLYCKIFFFLQYVSNSCTSEQTAGCGDTAAKDLVVPQHGLQVGRTWQQKTEERGGFFGGGMGGRDRVYTTKEDSR